MANQAWDDFVNGGSKPTTRQSVLDQINQSIQDRSSALSSRSNLVGGGVINRDLSNSLTSAALYAEDKQKQLRTLLSMIGGDEGGGSQAANPFGGGSGGGLGGIGGVPSMPAENRFAAGLSDAESRLRALLDDPDSIKQSGAYRFRLKQGEDAIQRNLGARGLLNSGNRLMELTKYGQDMGSQEYDAQHGRLSDMFGKWANGYMGERTANTNQFAAQSNAWNQAQANADRARLGYADIAAQNSRAAMSGGGSRSSGGGIGGSSNSNIYGYGQSAPNAWSDVLDNDMKEAKLKQFRGY